MISRLGWNRLLGLLLYACGNMTSNLLVAIYSIFHCSTEVCNVPKLERSIFSISSTL